MSNCYSLAIDEVTWSGLFSALEGKTKGYYQVGMSGFFPVNGKASINAIKGRFRPGWALPIRGEEKYKEGQENISIGDKMIVQRQRPL